MKGGNSVCAICNLVRSLVEEQTKHPVGDDWVHRDCYEKAVKRPKRKNPIGFK